MTAIPLSTFLRDRALYIANALDSSLIVELAVPNVRSMWCGPGTTNYCTRHQPPGSGREPHARGIVLP